VLTTIDFFKIVSAGGINRGVASGMRYVGGGLHQACKAKPDGTMRPRAAGKDCAQGICRCPSGAVGCRGEFSTGCARGARALPVATGRRPVGARMRGCESVLGAGFVWLGGLCIGAKLVGNYFVARMLREMGKPAKAVVLVSSKRSNFSTRSMLVKPISLSIWWAIWKVKPHLW